MNATLSTLNATSSPGNELYTVKCKMPFSQSARLYKIYLSYTMIIVGRIFAGINFAAAIPTVVANVSVIIVILKSNELRTISNTILLSILFNNVIHGMFSFPCYAFVILTTAARTRNCASSTTTSYVGGSLAVVSMTTVLILAYERYMAVFNPLRYEEKITHARVNLVIVFTWLFSFTLFFFIQFINATRTLAVVIVSLITISTYVINVIVHIKIFSVIRSLRKNQTTLAIGADAVNEKQQNLLKEKRTVRFVAYVICLYLIFYLPSTIKAFLQSIMKDTEYINYPVNTIVLLHSTVSPFLYAWQSPSLYRAVKQLWKCKKVNTVIPLLNGANPGHHRHNGKMQPTGDNIDKHDGCDDSSDNPDILVKDKGAASVSGMGGNILESGDTRKKLTTTQETAQETLGKNVQSDIVPETRRSMSKKEMEEPMNNNSETGGQNHVNIKRHGWIKNTRAAGGQSKSTAEPLGQSKITPEPLGQSKSTPEPLCQSKSTPEPLGQSKSTPEPLRLSKSTPEQLGQEKTNFGTPEEQAATIKEPERQIHSILNNVLQLAGMKNDILQLPGQIPTIDNSEKDDQSI
eukprot:gene16030-17650_t